MKADLFLWDCRTALQLFVADASVDAVVTDPPYGLSFMGKRWDYDVPDVATWAECWRVLKPGAHLVAFGGTRTYHRLVCAIEDAGFEIRDQIGWAYGSGFPKSHNGPWGGTALKPAWEPIVLARKPLVGTVADNAAHYGTGGLNIDACRVPGNVEEMRGRSGTADVPGGDTSSYRAHNADGGVWNPNDAGRWPANLLHDGSPDVMGAFPHTASGTGAIKRASSASREGNTGAALGAESRPEGTPMICYGDSGSAARFFYCAKASRSDRDDGLAEFEAFRVRQSNHVDQRVWDIPGSHALPKKNFHPTVKPTDLMRWLCRLVTPRGGSVLDPFMGSGSTGRGALLEGFDFIGVERDAAYMPIAQARIRAAAPTTTILAIGPEGRL